MLKLTAEHGEGECYVDPHKVFAVVKGLQGQTSILSDAYAYIGVKESAADVARMVDEAKGVLEAVRKAYGWLYSQQKYFNEGDHFEAGMSKYSENAMNELRPFLDKKYPLSRQHCPSVGTTKPYDPADHRL